jgi:hypothetical protein
VASIAAYGYIVETFKGDTEAAEKAYAIAAQVMSHLFVCLQNQRPSAVREHYDELHLAGRR